MEKSDKMISLVEGDKEIILGVEITKIDLSFWNMITFMVKWSFASIPALLIIGLVWGLIINFCKEMIIGGW